MYKTAFYYYKCLHFRTANWIGVLGPFGSLELKNIPKIGFYKLESTRHELLSI